MKILVTGANGFVGSNLVRRLVNQGVNVGVIIRPKSNIDTLNDVEKNLIVYTHNGTSKNMMSILQSSNPDIVCHLAAISIYDHSLTDVEPLIRSNILFGNQLVECMVKNNIYKFINTGTFWQHYQNEKYNPSCLYAATKQAFEDILKFYIEASNLNVITLKLFDNYGPNDTRTKLFNFLKKSIDNNQTINMSSGEQLIDIVYISDVIDAYLISIEKLISNNNQKYEEFSISSNSSISLKNLVDKYLQITNKKANIIWGGREYRSREIMIPWNNGKILPGWKPKISIDEGIAIMESENK